MKKIEKLSSKLFESFNTSKMDNLHIILGGLTSSKEDCNASSYDDDSDSKWKKDSTDTSDTVRDSDGCNPGLSELLANN